ncbi:hypothetical protein NCCP602_32260 [Brevibacterium metallidurans]|uniref:Uncharacterized protein n=1 Tax=Brevibacterium metallidurans TaxID=1482676 RepID=A0ABP3CE79_9MICO
MEVEEDLRHHRGGERRERRNPHLAALERGERRHIVARGGESVVDPQRIRREPHSGIGQAHPLRVADDEREADFAFELAHLLRDRRGREREFVGGCGEAACPTDEKEQEEPVDVVRR